MGPGLGLDSLLRLINAYGSRAVIEQAKGILMGYLDVGADEAFHRLAVHSQNTNTKVAALAAELAAAANHGRAHDMLRQWATFPETGITTRTQRTGGGPGPLGNS